MRPTLNLCHELARSALENTQTHVESCETWRNNSTSFVVYFQFPQGAPTSHNLYPQWPVQNGTLQGFAGSPRHHMSSACHSLWVSVSVSAEEEDRWGKTSSCCVSKRQKKLSPETAWLWFTQGATLQACECGDDAEQTSHRRITPDVKHQHSINSIPNASPD